MSDIYSDMKKGEALIRADERKAVLAELEGWLVDEEVSPIRITAEAAEIMGRVESAAEGRNKYRAELRAKLAEMGGTSTVVGEPKGERIYMTDTFRKEYTELDAAQREYVGEVKHHAEVLLGYMNRAVPPEERSERNRCMAIARTNLEQAIMWAVKGITTKQE